MSNMSNISSNNILLLTFSNKNSVNILFYSINEFVV